MNEVLTYEALKAERDSLAVENAALKSKAAELVHEASEVYSAYNATIKEPDGDFMDMQTLYEMQCIETPATDAALAAIQAQGVEKALAVVSACRENICPGGLSENRQYEESIVQPHLDGIADELENLIIELREAK